VVGNALLALYRLGDEDSITKLVAMGSHESPEFRATAAWVMGETGDTVFAGL
jgi:HEAT repeat protein